jgi:hypothetical protein
MLLTFRQRGWELGTVGRWLAAIGLGIAALAACIAVTDVSLPWDTDTNVLTGGAAGVVVGAFLALWTASAIERSAAGHEASGGDSPELPSGGIQQRAGTVGVQLVQNGRAKIKNQAIVTYPATPPAEPPQTWAPTTPTHSSPSTTSRWPTEKPGGYPKQSACTKRY